MIFTIQIMCKSNCFHVVSFPGYTSACYFQKYFFISNYVFYWQTLVKPIIQCQNIRYRHYTTDSLGCKLYLWYKINIIVYKYCSFIFLNWDCQGDLRFGFDLCLGDFCDVLEHFFAIWRILSSRKYLHRKNYVLEPKQFT